MLGTRTFILIRGPGQSGLSGTRLADKKPPGSRPGELWLLKRHLPVAIIAVVVWAEGAADEKAARIISVGGVAVITVRVVRGWCIIAHAWQWYTDTDKDSCLGRCRR
jgi:hypothetical protein